MATGLSILMAEPPAASLAFISHDKVVLKARELVEVGKFVEAEKFLKANGSKGTGDELEARKQLAEIIRRTRYEYSLSPEELVQKVRETVPDATPKEVEKWADQSKVRFRMIDGRKFYFSGEPKNIFLFSKEASARQTKAGHGKKTPQWQLTNHLAQIIAEAERNGQTEVVPVKHRFTHTLTISTNVAGLKAGSLVRVWLPYPQEYRQQQNVKLISASPEPRQIAPSAQEGNPVTGAPQRTIYFEETVKDPAQPLQFKEVVEYTSYAYYPRLEDAKVKPLPADWNGAYLGERLPHIALTPAIRKQAIEIVGSETNALVRAKKIFRWVSANIPWNSEDEYCTIPSFTLKGFSAMRGDCGVQNSVFISLCRAAGVPARWQSGFETKPIKDNWGMHDWAEIYIAPWGWLPADASYGVKPSADARIADFYCGHQDSYRMIVNLDWGRELFPPKKSLRSEPADFQRGEVEIDGRNLYYDEWSAKTEVTREVIRPAL
jgi:transglutaminase superfamily protein